MSGDGLVLLLPKIPKGPRPSVSPQRQGLGEQSPGLPPPHLVDDIDAIVPLLPLQEGMEVFEQVQ